MAHESVGRILKQVPKLELIPLISKWGKVPVWKINADKGKFDIVRQICTLAKACKVTTEDIHRLDLLVVINKKGKKLWKAYEMSSYSKITTTLSDEDYESTLFERRLQQYLYVAFSCSVVVAKHNHALWGRINSPSMSRPMYFIHFPYSPYVLIASASSRLFAIFTEELRKILGYNTITSLVLESVHPDSLAQILLHNKNKNVDYKYDNKFYAPKKRHDAGKIGNEFDKRINVCHSKAHKSNVSSIKRQFGDKVLPVLTTLEVSTITKFRGRRFIPDVPHDVTVQFQTKLKGPNILEGLRILAQHNLTSSRLPRFLTNVPNTGKQYLKITEQINTGNRSSA